MYIYICPEWIIQLDNSFWKEMKALAVVCIEDEEWKVIVCWLGYLEIAALRGQQLIVATEVLWLLVHIGG